MMLGGLSSLTNLPIALLRILILRVLGDSAPYQFADTVHPMASYDFVVVGAGGSGSVVAARLAEAGAAVLLLEAGGLAPPETALPGLQLLAMTNDDLLWKAEYTSEYENSDGVHGAFRNDQPPPHLIGKGIGGSTSVNMMQNVRGSSQDFDEWSRLGNTGWDYQSMLPYFRKMEDYKGMSSAATEKYHGKGGPMTLEMVGSVTPLERAFFRAGRELGYSLVDSSGPRNVGFSPVQLMVKNRIRVSTSEGYLRPNAYRKNLHIRTSAVVTKIIFDSSKRAVGVRYKYKYGGRVQEAAVKKEVIMAASGVLSPQLLMLSGVGPREHLREMGIPVVADVPGVGENLQTHPIMMSIPFAVRKGASLKFQDVFNIKKLEEALTSRTGILSTPFPYVGMAQIHLGDDDPTWPDMQVSMSPLADTVDYGVISSNYQNLRDETYDDIMEPLHGRDAITMHFFLTRAKSRGCLKLNSAKPDDMPKLNFRILSDPGDLKLLTRGIKFLFALANTTAMGRDLQVKYMSKPLRFCSHHQEHSDAYWECFCRHYVRESYHSAGTCKMAPATDPMGVVSPRLRLRGVSGVRVVDASIMPQIVTGNPIATVIAVAEKAADLIKQDWGYPTDPIN